MDSNIVDSRMNLIPKWITAEAFINLLREQIPEFEKIQNFKAYPALQPGENYSTLIVRVTVHVELQNKRIAQKSYIMKLPNDNHVTDEINVAGNIYRAERHNLNTLLPELEELYHNAGVHIKFGPTSHVLPQNPDDDYVLMDDLGDLGFKNTKRTAGLDLVHMERVLTKLAQYHAVSATRAATIGPYPEAFATDAHLKAACKLYQGMILSFKESFMEHLKSFKDGEKYESVVLKFFENVPKIIGEVLQKDPIGFNVLIHGDCWSNNIMFKYTEANEIDDVIFVDFQMPRWGPAALDLLYFIISSAQLDIKLTKFDYFIRFYYDHLIANLKLLKYPENLPALSNLFIQILKYGEFGFLTAIMTMAGILLDSTDKANMDNLMLETADAKDFKSMLYSNQRYHAHINELLPWFSNHGILSDE